MRTTRRPAILLPLLLFITIAAGACSGTGNQRRVATLGQPAHSPTSAAPGGPGGLGGGAVDPKFQDAMLKYAKCMRGQGVDMPDPVAGNGGPINLGGTGGPTQVDLKRMDTANQACQPILDAVPGTRMQVDPQQEAEFQAKQLEFTKCMRSHGVDMPDPVFQDGGAVSIAGGSGPGVRLDDGAVQKAAKACGRDGVGVITSSSGTSAG